MNLPVPGASPNNYSSLSERYGEFRHPHALIELGGKKLIDKDKSILINDIHVELTSGFEASVATFRIYNVYSMETGKFRFEDVKSQVVLGNSLTVSFGYLEMLTPVFTGFVAGITFGYDPSDMPYIEVTGMDVKGVMMANSYAYQLTAKSYSEAVREIFQKTAYENLQTLNAITKITVDQTPDNQKKEGESAETIEMVSESDYEFVVKAAKKFNFEFFTDCGRVFFRKAKSNTEKLMDIGVGKGLIQFEIGYSLTGMAETVEACSMDAGTGKTVSAKVKYNGKLSTDSKAKKLIKGSRHMYIDPSILSQEHADARAKSLMEAMEYRLGSLRCECIGLPEFKPGRFIGVTGLGVPADNIFYVTHVTHTYSDDGGYKTKLLGRAREVKDS
jgi:phage protein D